MPGEPVAGSGVVAGECLLVVDDEDEEVADEGLWGFEVEGAEGVDALDPFCF